MARRTMWQITWTILATRFTALLCSAWRVIEKADDRVTAEFQASIDEPALVAKWPADFRIRVSYQISANSLRTEIEVHNPDTKLLPLAWEHTLTFAPHWAKPETPSNAS